MDMVFARLIYEEVIWGKILPSKILGQNFIKSCYYRWVLIILLGDFFLHISFGSFLSSIYKDLVFLFHNEEHYDTKGLRNLLKGKYLLSVSDGFCP